MSCDLPELHPVAHLLMVTETDSPLLAGHKLAKRGDNYKVDEDGTDAALPQIA
jgi:hypothetical protein